MPAAAACSPNVAISITSLALVAPLNAMVGCTGVECDVNYLIDIKKMAAQDSRVHCGRAALLPPRPVSPRVAEDHWPAGKTSY